MIKKLAVKNTNSKKHTQDFRGYIALNRNAAGFNLETKELTYTLVCDKTQAVRAALRLAKAATKKN